MSQRHISGRAVGAMPFEKYKAFEPIDLPNRQWPSKQLTQAPRWCSVDLRDGNQALIDPMNVTEKLKLWDLLLEIGFAEIEVGFPAASQPDFDFIRRIIDEDRIPDGVSVQVLCQAREELIERTVEALQGAPSVIFHLYNSTSELQRRVVFEMGRDGIIDLAVEGTKIVREGLKNFDADVTFEYSPESFTGTELDFAVDICSGVAPQVSATAVQMSTAKSSSVPVKLSGEYSNVTSAAKFFKPSLTIWVPCTARSMMPSRPISNTTRRCSSEVELYK